MEDVAPHYVKAAMFKTLSTLMLATMTLCVRMLGQGAPLGETVFARAMFTLFLVLIILRVQNRLPQALHTRRVGGHFVRSLIGILGMFALYAALGRLPVVEVTAITFVAPLMTVILAAFVLRERVRAYRWGAVLFGLAGGLYILAPRLGLGGHAASGEALIGALLAMTTMMCIAGGTIQVRFLTATETTGAITFYMAIAFTLAGLATLPFGWFWPDPAALALVLGAGLSGALGQIFLTEGLRHAPASFVAPFEYLTLIWAFILGYFVLGEVPTSNVLIGALIVALAGLFVIWRERRLGLRNRRETPPAVP